MTVPNPDVAGRSQILEVHFKSVPRASDVDLKACPRSCTESQQPRRWLWDSQCSATDFRFIKAHCV